MNPFELSQPRSIESAIELLQDGTAVPKAGGVDLLDRMKNGVAAPARLVSLSAIPELRKVEDDAGTLQLGAGVTLAELAGNALVKKGWPALAEAAGHVATPQVRNMATLGGNLAQPNHCLYFRSPLYACKRKGGTKCFALEGDHEAHALFANGKCAAVSASTVAPALVAYDATVVLQGPKGKREVKADAFFVGDDLAKENVLAKDELVVAVRVPGTRVKAGYLKQQAKESFDWPLALAAVTLELDGSGVCTKARVVLGAAASTPLRAEAAEAALIGKKPVAATLEAAAKASTKGATPLEGNRFRLAIYETVVRRALERAVGGAS